MLDNVDSLAVTRAHANERRLQLQRLDRDPLQEAEDALLEHVPGEEYGVEAAEEDDPAPSAPHRSSRPDNSLWSGLASAPEARSRLQATYLRPPRTVTGHSAKEEAYVNAALRQLPAPPSAGSGAAPHPSLHQQADILDEQARHEVLGPQRTEQQHMVLLDRGQPSVRAKAFVLEQPPVTYPTPGPIPQPPPYILLPPDSLPSVADTARLFTLSEEQARVFSIYARLLLAEKAGRPQPPFNAILTGYAGTGKSHACDAILWFAYQHRMHQLIALVSYTWRAALHDTTPGNVGLTTTTFFGIHSARQSYATKQSVAARMRGIRLILLDEFSCCSPPHWARLCATVHNIRSAGAPTDRPQGPLADLHGLFAGDPRQLSQPSAPPMYTGAGALNRMVQPQQELQQPAASPLIQALKLLQQHHGDSVHVGVQLWRSIPYAFMLTHPFRQQDTDVHPNLLEIAEIFSGLGGASNAQVDAACDVLNSRAISQQQLAASPAPYLAVLRHALRLAALPHLYRLHAAEAQQTLLLWRSTDLSPAGGALSAEYLQELERLGGSENDGGVPAVCGFFHGVRYNMTTTVNPTLLHVHNNTATGTGIILDPREPAIPAGTAVHVLTYPPCAIIVKPDGLSPGHTLPHLQPGEIVVAPSIVDFTPSASRQPTAVTRYGSPLDAAYAVTDYYVQGASLRGFWLVHFGRPPTGGYHRATLYVIATRFRSLNDLHLLTPLWNNAHEERQLKLAFRKLAQRDPDLAAEWERLTALAATTAAQYDALLSALPAEPPV
ncbi:hypothetical protein GPECTOR_631g733 [Gonium pectorale]|uniref:ATP-dependent DNA helicase n=1 Tax=Gonium pectorale TaxID=33097 RepID=A0A150FUG0_GONPE|nr:hypothetical protein GPECTOR_631g733 [Gonium pectorale]|eukprot:KXZ41229.1 hypothetical protein GPECTOR_631g733 [Gonium pectorale]